MLTYSKTKQAGRKQTTSPASVRKKEYSSASTIQTKLTVGKANDKYEQEADRVADQVINASPTQGPAIQKKCAACEKEDQARTKPILQKKEEEEIQAKPFPSIMKMEKEEVQPMLQKKTDTMEEGTRGFHGGYIQKMEEEEAQMKAQSTSNKDTASTSVENTLKATRGQGQSLDSSTLATMEDRIGADFSGVRIHTDSRAVQMNRELGAQAFATGKDVYFNSGKYNPGSRSGQHLLAHELTHVVQQTPDLRMKKTGKPAISASGQKQISRWTVSGNTATVSQKGDTLAALAHSITGNWRDWGCIWVKKMQRTGKSWADDFYRWLEIGDTFDVSNLKKTTGQSVTIVMRGPDIYQRAIQRLYGGIAATMDFVGQLETISEGGNKPIQNLTIAGHSAGGRMWGANSSFTPGSYNPETPKADGFMSHGKKGPRRCWFTRNARVRFVGCSSETVSAPFSSKFLRRGAQSTGTNHWICGWNNVIGGWRALSVDDPPCNPATRTGTLHFTGAGFNGQAGLWVNHNGRL